MRTSPPKDNIRRYADTYILLEQMGHRLDREVERLYHQCKEEAMEGTDITRAIEQRIDLTEVLKTTSRTWDGGYVICGVTGSGESFAVRDPWGIRTAFWYRNDEVLVLASERPVIQTVFDAPLQFESDVSVSSVLYNCMSRTKYLKPSGRSRYTKMLADDMKVFYEKLGVSNIPTMNQIQRVLLRSRFDFSVVCQIAFFLGMDAEELTSISLTVEQIQKEQSSHYMKGAVHVDWSALDEETAPLLESVANGVYTGTASENGRPERVSERLVYREMGLLGHQLENMPRCKAIFERYTESYPESWARKIVWAYRKLSEQGKLFYWSDIRRLAGVKKKNFATTMPYLIKYADVDTVSRIMNLAKICDSTYL